MAITINSTVKDQFLRVNPDDTITQVLLENTADNVLITDTVGNFGSDNVEGALAELALGVSEAGKVDDVRNNASDANTSIVVDKIADMSKAVVKEAGKVTNPYSVEGTNVAGGTVTREYDGSTNRKTKLGDGSFIVTETSDSVLEVNLKDSGVTAGTYQGLTVDAKGRVTRAQDMKYATKQEVQEAMAGKARSFSYDDYKSFVAAVDALGNTAMSVNDNVLIKTLYVPDMWVTRVNAVSTQYVYTTDQDIVDRLNTTNGLTVGYYTFSQLETTKVDLDPYQTKEDNGLNTNDKTVVGAINEVKGVADGAATKAASNASVISDIQDGKVAVGEAKHATNATNVTTNINGKAITSIFETDGVTAKKATSAATASKVANKLTVSGQTSGGVEAKVEFDGSAAKEVAFDENDFDTTVGATAYSVELSSVVNAGTYTAVQVDKKGRVTAGGRAIAFIGANDPIPSDVMVNGLIFRAKA